VLVTWIPRGRGEPQRIPDPLTLTLNDGTPIVPANVYTWATALVVDGMYVVKVPANSKRDVTAVIGCAVMTGAGAVINSAAVKAGESVAFYGVGGIGLSAIAAAAVVGANPIIAVDLDDAKLELAKRFGATHGVNARKTDPIEAIRTLTPSPGETTAAGVPVAGADYVFDCIGAFATMKQLVPSARPGVTGRRKGGTAFLIGIPEGPFEFDASLILRGERGFVGSVGGSCDPDVDVPRFLDWYANGKLDLDTMVSARFGIDQIQEACDALAAGTIAGRAILEF
jgi:Zn-dependent alcohol dehydrogenase